MNKKEFNPLDKNKTANRNTYLTGFTLVEIIVAAIILALVTTGLAYVFLAGKRHLLHTRSKIQAVELGRLFVAPLQMQVRQGESSPGAQDGWDQVNNTLYLSTVQESRAWTGSAQNLDGIDYTPNYVVSRVRDPANNDTGLRRVKVNINWNEPTP